MLVLTRKENQVICIGKDITVMVVDIQAGQVRLGIVAPKEVSVDRKEIREQKEAM